MTPPGPRSVGAALAALDATSLAVLRAAATYGHTFVREGVLAADPSLVPATVDAALASLLAAGVLVRADAPSAASPWRFALPRMVDRLRSTSAPEALRAAHGRAAAWLEASGELDATVVAQQWLASDTPAAAGPWCVEAARNAMRDGDHAAALGWTSRALALPLDAETAAEQWLVQTEVHDAIGALDEAERTATEAWRVAPRGSTAWFRAASALAVLAQRLLRPERFAALGPAIEEALRNPATLKASAGLANAVYPMLQAGQYGLARGVLARLEELLASGERLDPALAPRVYAARALCALFHDDPAGYLAESTRAAEAYEALQEPRLALLFWNNVGFAQTCLGDGDGALATLSGVVRRASALGFARVALAGQNNLGLALALLGRADEAIAVERAVIDAAALLGDSHRGASARLYLSLAQAAAGDAAGAMVSAGEALAALAKQPGARVMALAIRARAALACGDVAGALGDTGEAMRVLGALGQVEEGEGLARLARVEALVASGAHAEAAAALDEARERLMVRARKIPTWEARRRFLEGVTEHARTMGMRL